MVKSDIVKTLAAVIIISLAGGCTTSESARDQPDMQLSDNLTPAVPTVVTSTARTGLEPFTFENAKGNVEWLTCQLEKKPTKAVALMHREGAGFDPKTFCSGWIAQVFLFEGYHVIGINRPGFGRSTGSNDFSGQRSAQAIEAGTKKALQSLNPTTSLVGMWGFSGGAAVAALASKKFPNLNWLILGNGIYDLEATLKNTEDQSLRRDLQALLTQGGRTALEDRSIAFDLQGLPKRLIIYHGRLDTTARLTQAESFRDVLAASEYSTSFQVIEGVGHALPWQGHQQLILTFLRSVK